MRNSPYLHSKQTYWTAMLTALKKKTVLVVVFSFIAFLSQAQLVITPETNAQKLAEKLVGTGITISNVTLNGSPSATGFFKNLGGTMIGLDSGIVLSTGLVKSPPPGTYQYGMDATQIDHASTDNGTAGDPDLAALVGQPLSELEDAVILEFDFVPVGDTVRFRYVFSSEEYPSFACSDFNDVFAFFISGPGISPKKNIALVPGTNIPVAINSINGGDSDPDGYCSGMGPGSPFTMYYIDNLNNPNFSHNGHTVVLVAEAIVQPCQTYHLKIAISDVFDGVYDSGVFIEAQSLTSTPLKIINGNPTTGTGTPYVIEGCTAGSIKIARQQKLSIPQPVNLTYVGTANNGTDIQIMPSQVVIPAGDSIVTVPIYPIADNVVEGDETFKIYVTFGSCGSTSGFYADSITILVRDQLTATSTVTPSACASNTGTITLDVPAGNGDAPYTYSLNGGPFQSSNTFTGLPTGSTLVSVQDANGCIHNVVANVGLTNDLALTVSPLDTTLCEGATFVPTVTSVADSYSWTPTGNIDDATIAQPTITATTSGQYVVSAYSGPCVATATINVTVTPGPSIDAGNPITIPNGGTGQLNATAGPGTYSWSPSAGLSDASVLNPFAAPSQTTTYTLTATTPEGCVSTDTVTVTVMNCVDPMQAFTPNGDGINDYWIVNMSSCYRTAIVQVFNRYGGKVFESRNYANNWDGTYKGKPLPDGTYYYVVTLELINGKKAYYKGNVTILR